MIWMTWRQHRRQALSTVAALLAVAALMVPTGLAMHNAAADLGLNDCRTLPDPAPDSVLLACSAAVSQFSTDYGTLGLVGVLFLLAPVLMGLFWGAPVVAREIEHGTHRLVWTQGVSRRRWALVKFGFVGAVALATSAVYGLGLSWWTAPLSLTGSRFGIVFFDMQGVVPIGYTLFAVALGIFAGATWPKVLPAMAITLAGFVGCRVALTVLARPRYLPAQTATHVPGSDAMLDSGLVIRPVNRGEWLLARDYLQADGTVLPDGGPVIGSDVIERVLYQPAGRFWLFQGIETGIFVILAVLLVGLAIRRIQRLA
jgi:hypothetical protein